MTCKNWAFLTLWLFLITIETFYLFKYGFSRPDSFVAFTVLIGSIVLFGVEAYNVLEEANE